MKNLTNEKKIFIVVIIIIMLTLSTVFLILINSSKNNELKEKDIKIQKMQEEIDIAQLPSQIERLTWTVEQFKRQSEKTLEKIRDMQNIYEFETLTYRCFQDQVNRYMENQEIDEEYCKIQSNLEQYRSKK